MRSVRVEFFRGERRFYRSLLHRSDGLLVEFQGGAYNKVGGRAPEVPHDLAHLIVEQELGLRRGVWGVLAAGGMFGHARVVAGRRAPHATRKGRAVIDEAGDEIMQAEILTRLVCDVAAGELAPDLPALRRQAGERWWADGVTRPALDRSRERLRAAGAAWSALGPEEPLEAVWQLG
ncbi:hypothetical protein [Conexibacter woesei]|uniref:hypothetical protein n=1 Tax=Conexibacter woesei TaxID=191495 RepID=UPI0002DB6252|nr:hypothetical protein [Conexibacter woesei]